MWLKVGTIDLFPLSEKNPKDNNNNNKRIVNRRKVKENEKKSIKRSLLVMSVLVSSPVGNRNHAQNPLTLQRPPPRRYNFSGAEPWNIYQNFHLLISRKTITNTFLTFIKIKLRNAKASRWKLITSVVVSRRLTYP